MTPPKRTEGAVLPSPPGTLTIALSLAKVMGWHVFPVKLASWSDDQGGKGIDKRPLVKWHEGATTDPELIATWWGIDFPHAWVGVHAGRSGIVTVDLDLDKGNGSGRANLAAAGLVPPKTPVRYKTRSGGQHLIYAAPEARALTIGKGHPVPGVDIRAGNGLMVYYGPAITERVALPPAPEWALIDQTQTYTRGEGSVAAWLARTVPGKPTAAVAAAEALVTRDGTEHDVMLRAVSELVKLGGDRGAGQAFERARATYLADYPDFERHWDNAASGSIAQHGLPPLTIPIAKGERKAIRRRNDPEQIEAAAVQRKREYRVEKLEERQAAPVDAPDVGRRDLTDANLAEELAEKLAAEWANVSGVGLLRYNGVIWRPVDETLLVETVRRMLRAIRAEEASAAILRGDAKHEADAKAIESRARIVAISRLAGGILLEREPKLDADPDVINTPTGIVDLRTGKLRERLPTDYVTKVTGAIYDPDATSRDWSLALQALPKKTARWLQIRFGQGASGRIPEDKAVPFLTGGGDNGKSVVVGAIRNALGTYAVTVPERLLLGNDNDHPTDIMTLEGARLALFEELPRGGRLNAQRLKLLSGTNRLSGRRMRQDFHEFPATHMLAGATNHLPMITDVDDAIWARVAPIAFPYKFVAPRNRNTGEPGPKPGTNQRAGDPGLRDRLAEEDSVADPAVLAWLVAGAVESYKRGVPRKPRRVRDALDQWRGDADPVLGFVRDHLEFSEGHAVVATDLYAEFGRYLENRGQQRWSDQLIATSFTGHSALDTVGKRQVKFGLNMVPSRPPLTMKPIPERSMAWVGVRFKVEDAAAVPLSPEVADLQRRMNEV